MKWTRVRHADTGGQAIIPVESLPLQEARGWEAFGDPSDNRDLLLQQVDQEAADEADAARARAEQAAAATDEASIPAVLDTVGGDPEAARAALDAEQAKDKPRSTLVAKLEQIITDADAAPPADDKGVTGG